MNETDKAYIAGFFDGEGCVQLGKNSKSSRSKTVIGGVYLLVQIVNNDKIVLDHICSLIGGNVLAKKSRVGHAQGYCLYICGKKAATFLNAILPYLKTKRPQAEAAIMFAETLHNPWRIPGASGRPLTEQALHLRTIAFKAFRQEIDKFGGRGLSWAI